MANVLHDTNPLVEHYWTGSRTETWYLDVLAVHPEAQGAGVGRLLVQWGTKKAEQEGVCASVIAALGRDRFYGRCGFVEVGRANVGLLKENGIQGGAIMFTDVKKSL